ncbi:acetolactate decarboxylase [bacterium]|nr:acetolactate decarboxylase [bacterium]
MFARFRFLLAFLALFAAAMAQEGQLHWVGNLHSVVGLGQDQARIQLASLRGLSHLYGFGPATGRNGEVSLFDGQLSVARMAQGQPSVSSDWDASASLLAYVQVADWREQKNFHLTDLDELDRQLHPLSGREPLAFRITGSARKVVFHILDRQGRPALGHEANRKIQVPFQLTDEPVECFGIYSQHHQGILTHRGSNLHIHMRTRDGRLSGHLDQLQMTEGSLWLAGAAAP